MKTISLRQFRDSVADLTESVEVVKRDGDSLVRLGTWTPQGRELTPDNLIPRIAGFGSPRPAPKRTSK